MDERYEKYFWEFSCMAMVNNKRKDGSSLKLDIQLPRCLLPRVVGNNGSAYWQSHTAWSPLLHSLVRPSVTPFLLHANYVSPPSMVAPNHA